MLFTALWHLLIYCPLAHWIFYYKGWLATYGVVDYAGGMVIHTASGVASFVLAFWVGGKAKPVIPHNVPFVLLGAALLWFGWFGFNAGSAVSASYGAGLAFTNTQLGAAAAMFTWGFLVSAGAPVMGEGMQHRPPLVSPLAGDCVSRRIIRGRPAGCAGR